MFKKSLSVLLALVMLIGVFSAFPLSAYSQEADIAEVGANVEMNSVGGSYGVNLSHTGYQSPPNPYDYPQCTWYCWGRAYEKLGIRLPGWSHAYTWDDSADANPNYSVGTEARANSIMVENSSGAGHVMFVEKVENGYAYITEGNYLDKDYHEDRINLSTMVRDSWTTHQLSPVRYIYLDGGDYTPQGHIMSESEGAGRTIPDGDYWIISKTAEDYFVDIPGNDFDTYNEKNVQTWRWESGLPPIYDVFHFTYLNNGFYKISQLNTTMVIDVFGGNLERGSNVSMWSDTGSVAQQWSIEKTDDGYRIRSRCNNYYMDIYDGKYESGTNILTWESNSGNNQRFSFIPYAPDEQPLANGNYKIASAVDKSCYIDIYGGPDFKDKDNIQIYSSPDEKFNIEYAGNGYYRISEANSNLMMEVNNDGELSFLSNGRNVIVFSKNNGKNQLWKIRENTDGTYCFINQLSGYYLDLEHANTDNGTNVSQYQYNGYMNQKWMLRRILDNNMISVNDVIINSSSQSVKPDITVVVDNNTLQEDIDYTVSINADIDHGKGTVTVTGIKNYCDTVTKEFNISVVEPTQPTTSILGDADGDGEVTIMDATAIQRYLAHYSVSNEEALQKCGDVNGGGVDIMDATAIQRYLAHYDDPYHIGEAIKG